MTESILKTINLNKNFGNLAALKNVNMEVRRGETRSIIGLNGAGKTTLFNVITGFLKPDGGKVIFRGIDITGRPPYEIVKQGISRVFQITSIFSKLTVYENVAIPFYVRRGIKLSFLSTDHKIKEEVINLLEVLDLKEKKDELAGNLSYGEKRRLEIAIALATNPILLLLDEPTSGMTSQESDYIMRYIQNLRKQLGLTVLLIEHDINIVMKYSDVVMVMHEGSVLAEGTPEEIERDITVQRIYLGVE
jgi:branched-chain amino acid transport system ATP-binding protein